MYKLPELSNFLFLLNFHDYQIGAKNILVLSDVLIKLVYISKAVSSYSPRSPCPQCCCFVILCLIVDLVDRGRYYLNFATTLFSLQSDSPTPKRRRLSHSQIVEMSVPNPPSPPHVRANQWDYSSNVQPPPRRSPRLTSAARGRGRYISQSTLTLLLIDEPCVVSLVLSQINLLKLMVNVLVHPSGETDSVNMDLFGTRTTSPNLLTKRTSHHHPMVIMVLQHQRCLQIQITNQQLWLKLQR